MEIRNIIRLIMVVVVGLLLGVSLQAGRSNPTRSVQKSVQAVQEAVAKTRQMPGDAGVQLVVRNQTNVEFAVGYMLYRGGSDIREEMIVYSGMEGKSPAGVDSQVGGNRRLIKVEPRYATTILQTIVRMVPKYFQIKLHGDGELIERDVAEGVSTRKVVLQTWRSGNVWYLQIKYK